MERFLSRAEADLQQAKLTRRTGILSAWICVQGGKVQSAAIEFSDQNVLRREAAEAQSLRDGLLELMADAARRGTNLTARVEFTLQIFEGIPVDMKRSLRQSFDSQSL